MKALSFSALFFFLSSSAFAFCGGLSVEKISPIASKTGNGETLVHHITFRTSQGKAITLIDDDGMATSYVLYQYLAQPALDVLSDSEDLKSLRKTWNRIRDKKVANYVAAFPILRSALDQVETSLYRRGNLGTWDKALIEAAENLVYVFDAEENVIPSYEEMDQSNLGFILENMIYDHPAYSSTEGELFKIADNNTNNPIGSSLTFYTVDLPYASVSKCGAPPTFSKELLSR